MSESNIEYSRIADDVTLGERVTIHGFVNLYGCSIGENSKIGAFVEIQKNSSIGKNCKISSHTFICEGITIQDNVFVGHNVTFINDRFPRSVNADNSMQTEHDWAVIPTVVEDGASIGSSATIMCGITIGRGAIIGAASMVVDNIPPGEVWAGNPARFIRKV